jgi:serine/threonine protein kinase
MSPEAVVSGVVDARSDIYALGAVAYYLVTGKEVFEGRTLVDLCAQHLSERPKPPSARVDTAIPEAVDRLILRCLEKKPEERFASAAELSRELRAAQAVAGVWNDEMARRWWTERGRALLERLGKRRMALREPDGSRVTMEIALPATSGTSK